jgi:hypothetical protein
VSTLLALVWLAAVDGGWTVAPPSPPPPPPASKPGLSAEDAEVLQNLELLEHLDEAKDLEMLQELSVER